MHSVKGHFFKNWYHLKQDSTSTITQGMTWCGELRTDTLLMRRKRKEQTGGHLIKIDMAFNCFAD